MNILITGATGFIGQSLIHKLSQQNHAIKALSRNGLQAQKILGIPAYTWNYSSDDVPVEALKDCEVIVHLMGENLGAGRWTNERKHEIHASRIISTRKLVAAAPETLKAFVCGSAIGIYPGTGDKTYDETFVVPAQKTFMQSICSDWEQEATTIESRGIRRVSIRTGVVLGHGGMIKTLLPLFKMGLGGSVGSGLQWLPWIHIDDLTSVFMKTIEDTRYMGAINAVSPHPVHYHEFAHALGLVLHRPTFLSTPAWMLKLMLGEAAALALNSYRIAPRRLLQEYDFKFRFAQLHSALTDLFQPQPILQ